MAERASLKRWNRNVNQAVAMSAILFIASCGSDSDPPAVTGPSSVTAPIIWQTGALNSDLSALALAEDGAPYFLVAYEDGGVQLMNFDGAPLSEMGPNRTASVGSGATVRVEDSSLVVYPGASRNNDGLVVFVYGEGMRAPFEVELTSDFDGSIEGVCAGASTEEGSALDIAYWTNLDNSTLVTGKVVINGADLVYEETERLSYDKYITSCDIHASVVVAGGGFGLMIHENDGQPVFVDITGVPTELAAFRTDDVVQVAMNYSGGQTYIANNLGAFSRVEFRAGLSSEAPETAVHLEMSDIGSEASFPYGFLAVESRKERGDTQLIFVDRVELFAQLSQAGS